jgi:Fe-S-cluster-containing dehydrogenase component
MMQRYFIFDPSRCFGCYGCVAACANANNTVWQDGPIHSSSHILLWRSVHKLPPEDGDHHTLYLSVSCNHCEHPPCVKACPANALEKRKSDGVVIHHKEKCIGCRYCQMACPYDAIKWDQSQGVVSKCHFCHERLAQGREPACVETCFGGALGQLVIDSVEVPEDYKKESPGLHHIDSVKPAIRFGRCKGIQGKQDLETSPTEPAINRNRESAPRTQEEDDNER